MKHISKHNELILSSIDESLPKKKINKEKMYMKIKTKLLYFIESFRRVHRKRDACVSNI
jgi:hypothetical protein